MILIHWLDKKKAFISVHSLNTSYMPCNRSGFMLHSEEANMVGTQSFSMKCSELPCLRAGWW